MSVERGRMSGRNGVMYSPIGELEAVNTDSPFHNMNAVDRTRPKLSTCASDCRVLDILEPRNESMVGDDATGLVCRGEEFEGGLKARMGGLGKELKIKVCTG